MPWKSKAQEAWGNSPAGEEALGTEGVKHWNEATKGKKLPRKIEKKPEVKMSARDELNSIIQFNIGPIRIKPPKIRRIQAIKAPPVSDTDALHALAKAGNADALAALLGRKKR
jgi:hypothetical protein